MFFLLSFCNCDEPEKKDQLDTDAFPNSEQIWGMALTMLATVVCWIFYTKVCEGYTSYARPGPQHQR